MVEFIFSPGTSWASPTLRLRGSWFQDSQSNVQVHLLIGAGLWQLSNLRNLCRESSFSSGKSESYVIPQLGDLVHLWRAVGIGECSSELSIWALLWGSWQWIQIGSQKSRWVVIQAHTRGPAISGNAELAGQTLRYFRMCKEMEAKMRKQTEKWIYAKASEVGSATITTTANNPSLSNMC